VAEKDPGKHRHKAVAGDHRVHLKVAAPLKAVEQSNPDAVRKARLRVAGRRRGLGRRKGDPLKVVGPGSQAKVHRGRRRVAGRRRGLGRRKGDPLKVVGPGSQAKVHRGRRRVAGRHRGAATRFQVRAAPSFQAAASPVAVVGDQVSLEETQATRM
jgi:hypothetical protein